MFRVAVAILGATLTVAGLWAQQSAAPSFPRSLPQAASRPALTEADQNALVEEFCTSCHNSTVKSGELILERFNVGSPLLSSDLLEKMIRKLRAGQMPPADMERPAPDVIAAWVEALEARADAKAARIPNAGWRPFQRLNRAEYARVVRDVLAVEIDASAILPPDTTSGGFDNIADVQAISPATISAYLRGAALVAQAAVGTSNAAAPSRRKIFTCTPRSPADEASCAESILRSLTAKAYRGTSTPADLTDALAFYARGRVAGRFDDGIRLAVQSMLMSPKFLFRLETPDASGALDDFALASRLSFFLWSSAPDDALLAAARSRTLHTPEQLTAQARRMLADPKAEALPSRFAAQWLRLQDLAKVSIDPKVFPTFDAALLPDMRRETELTVADLIRRDGSVLDLITSDRSFINERLARHYGVANVRGPQFRAVTMPESRRGLLGQGSVLTLTSLGTRTSPVLRGKWVLEVLLGTPPPPPPPNVPALEDSTRPEKAGVPLTTRQRVEEHRSNPACASCHRVIDPPGMTLENFDAVGAWRSNDNGSAVDTAAALYDGRRMEGAAGLRDALIAHQDMVLRNFTQQLMTYALGRRLSFRDMPAIRSIVRSASVASNRFSAFVTGIVSSDAFRKSQPQ